MIIRLLAFGKLKRPGLRELCDDYSKRISKWTKFEEIELRPEPIEDSSSLKLQALKRETERLNDRLESSGRIYILDEKGKSQTTKEWASMIENESLSTIHFVIGSSYGFSDEFKKQKNVKLVALGPQTLSHEIARVVLTEQIYRAMCVIKKHPYHHE